ncbi:hypothetical protein PROFUN_08446 [Planoprotostelium fungivorum]|uniref:FERM domain-containing protein n=1 Tax=Planoprotostelium fungivorum TaxID=1890364 RepID=A0A2P6N1R8_9EUKA|nr:hypothetical protein PROFUN_08446 [Planoprotostelium fungivorum]
MPAGKRASVQAQMEERNSVKIYFVDGSFKSCPANKFTTMEQLWAIASEKLSFSVKTATNFFIWGVESDLELLLYADTTLEEIKGSWPQWMNQFSNNTKKRQKKLSTDFRLVYKPTCIVPLSIERKLSQLEAVNIFFMEAIKNVVSSNYPCDIDTAVRLGGLQAQAILGDRNPAQHKVGYMQKEIRRFIPEHLHAMKRTEEWEELIFASHEKNRGQPKNITKMLYLQQVRQWKYYGSVFFEATFTPSSQTFYNQEFSGIIHVGVNHDGLHFIDPKIMKVVSVEFKDVVKISSNAFMFGVTQRQEDPAAPAREWIVKTRAGTLIDDLIHDWFAEIRATNNWIEEERVRQTTPSVSEANSLSSTANNTPTAVRQQQDRMSTAYKPKNHADWEMDEIEAIAAEIHHSR